MMMIVNQVDSSSWEFLSAASSSTNSTPTSTHKNESTSVHQISTTTASYVGQMDSPLKKRESTLEEARSSIAGGNSNRKILGGSRDSVYESEYDRYGIENMFFKEGPQLFNRADINPTKLKLRIVSF